MKFFEAFQLLQKWYYSFNMQTKRSNKLEEVNANKLFSTKENAEAMFEWVHIHTGQIFGFTTYVLTNHKKWFYRVFFSSIQYDRYFLVEIVIVQTKTDILLKSTSRISYHGAALG